MRGGTRDVRTTISCSSCATNPADGAMTGCVKAQEAPEATNQTTESDLMRKESSMVMSVCFELCKKRKSVCCDKQWWQSVWCEQIVSFSLLLFLLRMTPVKFHQRFGDSTNGTVYDELLDISGLFCCIWIVACRQRSSTIGVFQCQVTHNTSHVAVAT